MTFHTTYRSPKFFISDEEILPGLASEINVMALLSPIEKRSSIVSSLADLFAHFR